MAIIKSLWLTTVDNPWDPRDEFEQWLSYDIQHGHKTCETLANEANTAAELSNADNRYYVEEAIKKLVSQYPELYKAVEKEEPIRGAL